MRPQNLDPLYRTTVGFDRLFSLMDNLANGASDQGFPPYNIEKLGENAYRITMAVAGFTREDLEVEVKEGTLRIVGKKTPSEGGNEVLYRGIAERSFERRFQLADHVQVNGADIRNGLLHIDLQREVPEAMKPRRIEIGENGMKSIDAA
ncbi:MAG: Hsp20 family protein [Pseudomonadota bacterium]